MSAAIATLIGLGLSFLAEVVTAWISSKKTVQQSLDDGAAKADAAANKESTDAITRMAQADAQPRSHSAVADRLRDGSA